MMHIGWIATLILALLKLMGYISVSWAWVAFPTLAAMVGAAFMFAVLALGAFLLKKR